MKTQRKTCRGMSLVEVVGVIAVVGLVTAAMVPLLQEVLQAKVGDAAKQLTSAGTTGTTGATFKLDGMKFYQPPTKTSNMTTKQDQNMATGYDKGSSTYKTDMNVTRNGTETTTGPTDASKDKDWLGTKW